MNRIQSKDHRIGTYEINKVFDETVAALYGMIKIYSEWFVTSKMLEKF